MAPITPASVFAAFAGGPLARKLRIRPGLQVALTKLPQEFLQSLGRLPAGIRVRQQRPRGVDLVIRFGRTPGELERTIDRLAASLGQGVLWIAWRKGGSAAAGQLTQTVVRKAGLDG